LEEMIRYEQVNISYDGKLAVEDVSFSVAKGEILGIVGGSGSGKSSLIKASMGLLGRYGEVSRGDIWYDGKNLLELSRKELRKICGPEIGMVFQSAGSSFCSIRTIRSQLYELVTEHQKITRKEFEEKAEDMLRKFKFENPTRILESYPFELSGGMQQRVGIVAAMLLNPKVLMADEPTSALDVFVQKQIVEEMLMVREYFGTTILLVTHNIGVVRAMADNMLVLCDGKTMEYGATKDILNHPQADYTKKLISAVPQIRR